MATGWILLTLLPYASCFVFFLTFFLSFSFLFSISPPKPDSRLTPKLGERSSLTRKELKPKFSNVRYEVLERVISLHLYSKTHNSIRCCTVLTLARGCNEISNIRQPIIVKILPRGHWLEYKLIL